MTNEVEAPAEIIPDLIVESEPTTAENTTEEIQTEKTENTESIEEESVVKPEPSRHENKVARLNRKINEERARAEMLERQIEELKPKQYQESNDAPQLENFNDVEEYASAKAQFIADQSIKRQQEERDALYQRELQIKLQNDWDKKVSSADDKYDDFYEKVGDIKPTHPIYVAIMQAENGDEIAYHLANNMDEAIKLFGLDSVSAIRAIGKLETKLLSESVKVKTPSKAPEPIAPIKGNTSQNKTIFEAESQEEFEKIRRMQLKRR